MDDTRSYDFEVSENVILSVQMRGGAALHANSECGTEANETLQACECRDESRVQAV